MSDAVLGTFRYTESSGKDGRNTQSLNRGTLDFAFVCRRAQPMVSATAAAQLHVAVEAEAGGMGEISITSEPVSPDHVVPSSLLRQNLAY